MTKKSIGVIGQGFVGGSLSTVFIEKGVNVYAFDIQHKYVDGIRRIFGIKKDGHDYFFSPQTIKDYVSCIAESFNVDVDIVFVCVPTPMDLDTGECDTSIVESVLDELSKSSKELIAVIKSTIPPGTTEKFNKKYSDGKLSVVFSPEFLTEANALNDMRYQSRIIVGGPPRPAQKVFELFNEVFPNVPIALTSSTNAEFVKYMTNAFLFTKVIFANQMFDIIEEYKKEYEDVSYDSINQLFLLDPRIGKSHTKVPGPDGDRGVGGHCFPKDMSALISIGRSKNVDVTLLEEVQKNNNKVRTNKDWLAMEGRAVSRKIKEE